MSSNLKGDAVCSNDPDSYAEWVSRVGSPETCFVGWFDLAGNPAREVTAANEPPPTGEPYFVMWLLRAKTKVEAQATWEEQNRGHVRMPKWKVGDKVLTLDDFPEFPAVGPDHPPVPEAGVKFCWYPTDAHPDGHEYFCDDYRLVQELRQNGMPDLIGKFEDGQERAEWLWGEDERHKLIEYGWEMACRRVLMILSGTTPGVSNSEKMREVERLIAKLKQGGG